MTRRSGVFVGVLLFVVCFWWSYVYVVSPAFSYMGYRYQVLPLWLSTFSWGAALVPAFWLPYSITRPSQVVYWILYILVLVPGILVPAWTLTIDSLQVLQLQSILLTAFALLGLVQKLPLLKIPRLRISDRAFWLIIGGLCVTFYVFIMARFGLRFSLLSFADVYDVRAEYAADLVASGRLVAYAVSWQGYVINPFFISTGLVKRRPVLIGVGLVGQLLLYSLTGSKSVFLSGIYVLGLLIALGAGAKRFGLLVSWGSAAVVGIATSLDLLLDSIIWSSLFVRRLIATPGLLTGYYYDFFSTNPKLFLSHSILQPLITYPYSLSPPHLIGYFYFGNADTGANANLWAEAYANFGLLGIVMFTLVFGLLLWVFDSFAVDKDQRTTALTLGIPAFALSNSALFTSFLTHGIGLAFLLIYLMPPTKECDRQDSTAIH